VSEETLCVVGYTVSTRTGEETFDTTGETPGY